MRSLFLFVVRHKVYFFIALLGGLSVACRDDVATPSPGSVEEPVMKLQRVTWSENDYQLYTYNSEGMLSRYTSQWTYINDGSNTLKKVVTDFTYSADKKLISSQTQGLVTRYYYTGHTLDRTEEYDHHNRLVISHYPVFDNNKKLREVRSVITDPMEGGKVTGEIKKTYTYDNRGNVTEQKEFTKQPGGMFELSLSIHYKGYDDKKNAEPEMYPHFMQVKKHTNNPASEISMDKNGTILYPVKTFSYQYNDEGYPVKKTVTLSTGTQESAISASLSYE